MKFKQLEYFIAVAEELHFGRAAERLGIAQPPLSRQIKQFEDELEARLFIRGRNQIMLTQAGEKFFIRAQDILREINSAKLEAKRIGQGAEGRLRIGFVGSSTYGLLPNLLKSFRKHYPNVNLSLFPMNNAGLHKALIRREIDIAIARPKLNDAEILSKRLIEEDLVLAIPDTNPLAQNKKIDLCDLADQTIILYPEAPRPSFADHVLDIFQGLGVEVTNRVFTMDFQTAISLVSIEVGIAVVPKSVGEVQRNGVRFINISNPDVKTSVSLNHRIDEQGIHCRKFIDIAMRLSKNSLERK